MCKIISGRRCGWTALKYSDSEEIEKTKHFRCYADAIGVSNSAFFWTILVALQGEHFVQLRFVSSFSEFEGIPHVMHTPTLLKPNYLRVGQNSLKIKQLDRT